jgi:UTP--glucose-1-phosphate uridylyltransferase
MPKELLPLFDRPVIHHLLEEVAAVGIPEALIVTRPGTEEALRRYFSADRGWDQYLATQGKTDLLQPLRDLTNQLRISFSTQSPDLPYGTGAPILAVQDRLTSPFVYLYGDDVILERPVGDSLRALVELYESGNAAAVVGAHRVPRQEISQVGSIAYWPDTDWWVCHILEKPAPESAPSLFTPIGRQVLSPCIVPVLVKLQECLPPGRELWMTDALSSLAGSERVLAPHIRGRWLTTGDPLNLLKAGLAFSRL